MRKHVYHISNLNDSEFRSLVDDTPVMLCGVTLGQWSCDMYCNFRRGSLAMIPAGAVGCEVCLLVSHMNNKEDK